MTLVVPEPLLALAGLIASRTRSRASTARAAPGSSAASAPTWLADRPTLYSWLGSGTMRALASVAAPVTLLHVERGPGDLHAAGAFARAAGLRLDRAALWRGARVRPAGSARASPSCAAFRIRCWRFTGAQVPRRSGGCRRVRAVATRWRAAGGGVVELLGPRKPATPRRMACRRARLAVAGRGGVARACRAYVGNDSGVSHLAAAVQARPSWCSPRLPRDAGDPSGPVCTRSGALGERRRIPSLR